MGSDWDDDSTEDREEYMQRAAWHTANRHRETYNDVLPGHRDQVISERQAREQREREQER